MAFMINKKLVFIDSIQFMNSNLEKLVQNWADNDFKNLTQEFVSKNLDLLEQKDAYPYGYMDSFERFSEKKLPDKKSFFRSLKDGATGDDGKKLDGHITNEEYLTFIKIWNEFNMKRMDDHHDHYLQKRCFVIIWCFWKVYCYVFKILQTWSLSLFQFFWIKLGCDVNKMKWLE